MRRHTAYMRGPAKSVSVKARGVVVEYQPPWTVTGVPRGPCRAVLTVHRGAEHVATLEALRGVGGWRCSRPDDIPAGAKRAVQRAIDNLP